MHREPRDERAIFTTAPALPAAERAAYPHDACGGDDGMRGRRAALSARKLDLGPCRDALATVLAADESTATRP